MQAEGIDSALEKMMDELAEHGWSTSDQIFSNTHCFELRDELLDLESKNNLVKAEIGHLKTKIISQEIRGDYIFWLDPNAKLISLSTQFAETLLQKIQSTLNSSFYLGLKSHEAHFAYYPVGAKYDKHCDNHQGLNTRSITFVLYLNNWKLADGGELVIYSPDNDLFEIHRLEPKMGQLILFRSELFPHQVLPSIVERCSLTGWFRTDI